MNIQQIHGMEAGPELSETYVCDFCQAPGATQVNDEGFTFHPGCARRYCDQQEPTRGKGSQPLTTLRRIEKRGESEE